MALRMSYCIYGYAGLDSSDPYVVKTGFSLLCYGSVEEMLRVSDKNYVVCHPVHRVKHALMVFRRPELSGQARSRQPVRLSEHRVDGVLYGGHHDAHQPGSEDDRSDHTDSDYSQDKKIFEYGLPAGSVPHFLQTTKKSLQQQQAPAPCPLRVGRRCRGPELVSTLAGDIELSLVGLVCDPSRSSDQPVWGEASNRAFWERPLSGKDT